MADTLRICVLTTSYPRFDGDDAGIFIGRLVNGYSGRGVRGVVFVPKDADEKAVEVEERFRVSRVRYGLFHKGALCFGQGTMPNIRKRPLLVLQIPGLFLALFCKAWLGRREFDAVHANWIFTGAVAWLLKLCTAKPYILTLRGEDVSLLNNRVLRLLFKPVLRGAKNVTSVNQGFLERLKDLNLVSSEKLVFVPNGVSIEEVPEDKLGDFCSAKNLDRSKRYLLFVGRITPKKGIDQLIKLLAEKELVEYELLLCGRIADLGYLEKLKELSVALGVFPRVQFIGGVHPREVSVYLKVSRYYVSASEWEGRPNSVLEAMAMGVPVVISNIPAHAELVSDGITGVLFNTVQEAASKIKSLDGNDVLRSSCLSAAKSSVSGLGWESCAEKYLSLLND